MLLIKTHERMNDLKQKIYMFAPLKNFSVYAHYLKSKTL